MKYPLTICKSILNQLEQLLLLTEEDIKPIFTKVPGVAFNALPAAVQKIHNTTGQSEFKGRADSLGPSGFSGRLVATLFGFPGAKKDIPVELTITAAGNDEYWTRNFDGKVFKSCLSLHKAGYITERFGPLSMRLGLHIQDNCLHYPVISAKLFGLIPLPRILLPKSTARECVDTQGRFTFDVHVLTPFGARIAHYRGYLESAG